MAELFDKASTLPRRRALATLAGAALAPLAAWTTSAHAQALAPSAPQSLGPFYPRGASERPRQTDADLLVLDADRVLTLGTPILLVGRVRDTLGQPVPDASVELWQCDANAIYHHPAGGAEARRDPNFQGYGTARADARGEFVFRTILPVAYPGRTPHIHVRIAPERGRALGTQLYLPDHPGNARDFLFSQLSPEQQRALLLALAPSRDGAHPLARGTKFTARAEIVLA
jgi:protocatechuate 3,4-dioxygenase beta subunit